MADETETEPTEVVDPLPQLRDIREVDESTYWEELRSRWGALLSYRYIGAQFSSMNTSAVDPTVRIRHDMRNPVGGLMSAPLAITCPAVGGKTDLQAVPNPVIHSMQLLDDGQGVERIQVLRSQGLHAGRRLDYGRAQIVDADDHDRVIAMIECQGASIGDVPPGLGRFGDDPVEHIEDSPELPPLWQVFGATRRDDGHWMLPQLTAELASPDAALHLGPQHIVLEAAAIDLASDLVGTDRLQVLSTHVMFVARGKVGPFRVEGAAYHGTEGRIGVQLTIHDEGNEDRRVTAGAHVFRTT
jgi:hypothetical protein